MQETPEYLDSMGRLVGFAARAVTALTAELLQEHGLTVPVTDLAHYTKATVPAASRLVDRMVDQGLLERKARKSDRRVVEVWLTSSAKSMRNLMSLYQDVNECILEGFSETEAKRFAAYLERITTNATRHYAERRTDDPLVV